MTTALYRRYRPDTFQDVIGQEHVTAPLMAALRGDRVTHAYLFSGPRGCGKTTSARILARCLNCERFPTDTPCGTCPSCRDLATGGPGSLDVVEIDAASHNGVDDARDLRERAVFAPARDRYKIFILDEAHMVTPQGFNALLKLVEEPPAHVKFIFATTEPEKVIGTIRSRTHHYPFRLVPPDTLEAYLGQLCHSEGVAVGPGVFPLVTRAGGGSVRDTLSVMDQLIGGAVDAEVGYQRAVALLGYTDTTMLDQCVDSIAAASGAGVFRVVDRVIASGHDPRRFVEDLLQRLRDLLVIALAGAEAGPALGSLPADELERMEVQARTIGSATLSRYADLAAQALTQMVGATSPRLQLELLMARLLVPQRPQAGPAPQGAAASAPAAPQPGAAQHQHQQAAPAGQDPRALAASIARRASGSGAAAAAAPSPAVSGWPGPDTSPAAPVGPEAPPSAQVGRAAVSASSAPSEDLPAHAPGAPASEVPASRPEDPASAPVDPPAATPPAAPGAGEYIQPGTAQQASGTAGADGEMIRTRWGEVLEAIKRERRATWALVEPHAQPGDIEAGVFRVLFRAPGLVNAFSHGHAPVVAQALHQALGLQVQVEAVLLGGPGGPDGPGPEGGPDGRGPAGGPGPTRAPQTGGAPGARTTGSAAPDGHGPAAAAPPAAAPAQTSPVSEAAVIPAQSTAPEGARAPEPSPEPEPAPEAAPEPIGWGEVAPIGQARTLRPAPGAPGTASAATRGAPEAPSPEEDVARPEPQPPREPAEAPLATVHRLHALPETPGGASSSAPRTPVGAPAQEGLPAGRAPSASTPAPAAPDPSGAPDEDAGASGPGPQAPGSADAAPSAPSPDTSVSQAHRAATDDGYFSDGVPLPDEPVPFDAGGEDAWEPPSASVSAAMAAARAAARGEAPPPGAAEARPAVRLEDDVISEDDEDAEEAGVVGLEVVKRLLGATVLEEVVITDRGTEGA